ncbi:c-type cytochrome biogenesis protein CcsB [Chroococcidiopsis sp. FACHB-1243]|uniref:c-type cytochrome biogenesis protein CcsB n=1 Tax=Chroococcidiopsis sp. [FACHB-1243] TaxID=2692781 RepID=UPI001782CA83|nr:c-type cytochrome biogenesis protein CcsB [Chroococcidiopsis sp. [FACHB-1243]]MBD2306217.1 c-type cytochrome biogenesis protein CcsB [Chroococcidiopsis sp. [FACHB-1243]]
MNLVLLQNWLDNASFAVLFLTMLVYWVGAAFPGLRFLPTVGTAGIAIANLCIATLLGARWLEAGYFPISNLYESLFFLAWGVTTVHLIAESSSRSRLVGVFTAPVAMGIAAFAALTLPSDMQTSAPLVPALKSNWLMMHVSVMMLSYAALLVGSLLAIAFLVVSGGKEIELHGSSVGTGGYRQNGYRLQRNTDLTQLSPAVAADASNPLMLETNGNGKTAVLNVVTSSTPDSSTGGFNKIFGSSSQGSSDKPAPTTADSLTLSPQRLSLAETLDNISYRTIGLGFPLLTIGIIAGAVWANEAWGSYWSWDPKETWALIAWLVFAAYLHARITRGWQGRRPAILAATGFVIVWVCYLGVNLLGKGLHSYGWFF